MSISSIQSNINRIQREISELHKKLALEQSNETKAIGKINQAQLAISRSSSISTLQTKMRELERLNAEIAKFNTRKAEINKKLASKTSELFRYQSQLQKEEEYQLKKQNELQKKIDKERLDRQKQLTQQLNQYKSEVKSISVDRKIQLPEIIPEQKYDVFISHASEDKDDFVRPFAEELINKGVNVWYDEMTLKWGESLRQNIDKGLVNSRFGVVVLSKSFINKEWTQYELNGLITSEINGGNGILPIWHDISKDEILKYSPSLADKLALNTTAYTVQEIAGELLNLLGK